MSAGLLQQGLAAHRAGRGEEAAALYRAVLAAQPDQADALYLLAMLLLAAPVPALAEATGLLRRAAAAQPGFALAHKLLGDAFAAAGEPSAAIGAYRAALAAKPDLAEAHLALGRALFAQRRYAEAAGCFDAVLAARPDDVAALNNRAATAQMLGDIEGAVASYRRALALRPDSAELLGNLGCALAGLGQWEPAATCLRRALAVRPGDPETLANLAAILAPGEPEAAIASYRAALAAAPDNADAHYGLGLLLLREGRYREGWAEAEWWGRTAQGIAARHPGGAPDWDGSPGDGMLLVYAQQGIGDTLQFVRLLALAARRRPVVLEAPRSLHRLLASLEGAPRLVAPGTQGLPDFAASCSLLSLPHRLGITLENVPAAVPYLRAEPEAAARWAARLAGLPGLKVGLCWAGNPLLGGRFSLLRADRRRSLALARLAALAGLAGVSFVSLQKGAPGREAAPAGLALHDWTADLHDFADTAALVEGLDLVISVDTAVAHLAGALGRPVWLLNRWDSDWRWLRGRDDSPWYPTLRQFRQPVAGDWDTPLAAMRAALLRRAGAEPAALYQQARAAAAAGQRATAIGLYRDAVALAPDMAEAHNNLGNQLAAAGRPEEALAAYAAALAARPGYAEALANQGIALKSLGRLAAAEASLRRAVALAPGMAAAHNALGTTLSAAGRLQPALQSLRAATRLAPGDATMLVNQGLLLARLQRPAEAIACHRRAVALRPDSADAHLALAEALLLDGQYREGWREYAWRERVAAAAPRRFSQPLWDRATPAGGTVLLHGEQGLGDTLQFCRYAPLVAARARVVLEAPAPLVRLLAGLEGVSAVVARGAALPDFAFHCPLPGLPGAFASGRDDIPARVPYLRPATAEAARWRARLAGLPGRRVGLCWAGNADLVDSHGGSIDQRRSLPLAALAPLGAVAGVSFVSLQKGPASRQTGLALHDWTGELHDFADTAALVAGLDLVISVDTAVAHLAGALGRPVWLLNRWDTEWRWLLGRSDSPWYPTLRQFRQPELGDWAAVVEAARVALADWAAGPGATAPGPVRA